MKIKIRFIKLNADDETSTPVLFINGFAMTLREV